jgi:hypothetical protein
MIDSDAQVSVSPMWHSPVDGRFLCSIGGAPGPSGQGVRPKHQTSAFFRLSPMIWRSQLTPAGKMFCSIRDPD